MQQLILIGALLLALALLAQLRRRRIAPPEPIGARLRPRLTARDGNVEIELRGVRGAALSFHRAHWQPPVEVLDEEGPLTLVAPRDVRRYVVAGAGAEVVELRGVWEQLTFRELVLRFDLAGAARPAEDAAAAVATAANGRGVDSAAAVAAGVHTRRGGTVRS